MDSEQFQHQFPTLAFKENVILAPYTYMKVGGPAKIFVEVQTKESLFALCSYCFMHQVPFVILGGASNTIIADQGIDKLVIRNVTSDIHIEDMKVTADTGVITAVLAKKTAESGLTGFEYYVGVPGTIGGAIYNNSHFKADQLIGNYLVSVEVCTPDGKLETWERSRLQLGYDQSIFQRQSDVILSATFVLTHDDPAKIQERILAAAKQRATTQPIGIPSSGCMYKNPKITAEQLASIQAKQDIPPTAIKNIEGQIQIAAGFLIDRAGLKGTKVGDVEVSDKHATYMVNTGKATTTDIESLCRIVEKKVLDTFGVILEREVFFL